MTFCKHSILIIIFLTTILSALSAQWKLHTVSGEVLIGDSGIFLIFFVDQDNFNQPGISVSMLEQRIEM